VTSDRSVSRGRPGRGAPERGGAALGRLEAETGTPLLRWSGRTPQMTHAGTVFKRHVDALPPQLDDGTAAASQLVEPETGTVGRAFQHFAGTWLVPDLIRTCRAAHPGAVSS
jgi:LysR family transcriptional regulator, transcription activator of glutamate synthase operon